MMLTSQEACIILPVELLLGPDLTVTSHLNAQVRMWRPGLHKDPHVSCKLPSVMHLNDSNGAPSDETLEVCLMAAQALWLLTACSSKTGIGMAACWQCLVILEHMVAGTTARAQYSM